MISGNPGSPPELIARFAFRNLFFIRITLKLLQSHSRCHTWWLESKCRKRQHSSL
jgi:hypothetical protein